MVKVVILEGVTIGHFFDRGQAGGRAGDFGEGDGDGAMEGMMGRTVSLEQGVVERKNARPFRRGGARREAMLGRDAGLEVELAQLISSGRFPEVPDAFPDQSAIPESTILLRQQEKVSPSIGASWETGRAAEHERKEGVTLRLSTGWMANEKAGEPNRFAREIGANQFRAPRGLVAFVEQEVEDGADGPEPFSQVGAGGDFERDFFFPDLLAPANEAFRDRRAGGEKRPRDLALA